MCFPVLLFGPTASGKTALALELAERIDAEIINADSMQLYADLPILTAHPSAQEQARVPHHLYGIWEGAYRGSVAAWKAEADAAVKAGIAKGRWPLLVGGTGLYQQVFCEGLAPIPAPLPEVEAEVRALAEVEGAAGLHAALLAEDPVAAGVLNPNDTQRMGRALALWRSHGRSWVELRALPRTGGWADALSFVMEPDRVWLYARIDARFDRMLASGVLDEVAQLARNGLDPDLPLMRALGLRPLLSHLAGSESLASAREAAQQESRRYAKRQLTWARNSLSKAIKLPFRGRLKHETVLYIEKFIQNHAGG